MGVGAALYMYDVVVKKFTFAISSPDDFLVSIVDTCLSCEDIVLQNCAMVRRWRIFVSCIFSEPCAAHFRHAF